MKKYFIAASAAAVIALGATAQGTGALSGTESEASVTVNATIAPMVRVAGLQDLSFTIDADTLNNNFGSTRQSQQFCVYSNVTADGDYTVQVGSDKPRGPNGDPYTLVSSAGDQLNHFVHVTDDFANPFKFINPGLEYARSTTAGGLARPTDLNCTNSGDNAQLTVGFRNARVLAAVAGDYTGTLTVTVAVP